MRHQDIRDLLGAYLDNELEDREKRQVDEHLGDCRDCREELAGLRELDEFARSLSPAPQAETYWERFPARIKAALRERQRSRREKEVNMFPVSYTHLTLPTNREV